MTPERVSCPRKRCRSLVRATLLISALAASSQIAFAASTASSSAFGEQVDLRLMPLLGGSAAIGSGPLPQVSGTAPPPYSQHASLPGASASDPATGTIVTTGLMIVNASSTVPTGNQAAADAEVDNPSLFLIQLLTIHADKISSTV